MRPQTPRVLLVHPPHVAMGDARRRAEVMALVLGAELRIVKLAHQHQSHTNVFFPQHNATESLQVMHEALADARVLERWQLLRERKGHKAIDVVLCEATIEALTPVVSNPEVALVVLPAAIGDSAQAVTQLAALTHVPVLLAHPATGDESLVIATNFEDANLPVIRRAWPLAARLEADLTIVHNAPTLAAQVALAGSAGVMPIAPPADEQTADIKREALVNACDAIGLRAHVEVTRRNDAATGIVETAAMHHADVIVVGVRAQRGAFSDGVAERVCATARQSVLVVPV